MNTITPLKTWLASSALALLAAPLVTAPLTVSEALADTRSDAPTATATAATKLRVIVQGTDADAARAAIEQVGGRVRQRLNVIRSMSAEVTLEQRAELEALPGIRVWNDAQAKTSGAALSVKDKF